MLWTKCKTNQNIYIFSLCSRKWKRQTQTTFWSCSEILVASSVHSTPTAQRLKRSASWLALGQSPSVTRWSRTCISTAQTRNSSVTSQPRQCRPASMPSVSTVTSGRPKSKARPRSYWSEADGVLRVHRIAFCFLGFHFSMTLDTC